MKNADMPAMPQSATKDGYPCNYYDYAGPGVPTGLTKREEFALKIMAGIYSNPAMIDDLSESSAFVVAAASVKAADALLAELDKNQGEQNG